jgi:hypothetical protein
VIDRFEQLDPIEISLRELADAEQADLFRKTRVDARSLLRMTSGPKRTTLTVRTLRWGSIAAVFALAATICGWIFTTGTESTRMTSIPIGTIASATTGCDGTFSGCLTGPNGTPQSACRGYDYDADGDIDLVDARTYQLNCTAITR